jgi:hypothetical protein
MKTIVGALALLGLVVLGALALTRGIIALLIRFYHHERAYNMQIIPADRWTETLLDSYKGDARKAREHVIRLITYHRAALARCEAAQFDLDTLLTPQ